MHIFQRDHFATNDLLTPGPLLRNLGAVVGEFNGGLDSENVKQDEITAPQLEFEAWNEFTPVEVAGPVTITFAATGAKSDWTDIPGAQTSVVTQDGILHVTCLTRWKDTSGTAAWYPRQIRICVDGGPLSQGPQVGFLYDLAVVADAFKGYLQAFGDAPVGAGTHDVRVQVRALALSTAVSVATEFTNLRLLLREGKR